VNFSQHKRPPFLLRLADAVRSGVRELSDERRSRHRRFVLQQQRSNGGFAGRLGDSDLYYTTFGLRALAALGDPPVGSLASAGRFLQRFEWRSLDGVELLNWLSSLLTLRTLQAEAGKDEGENGRASARADATEATETATPASNLVAPTWPSPLEVAERLERLRTADGGYAKRESARTGSTYQSFLVCVTYELLGLAVPEPERLVGFLSSRRRPDGSFAEVGAARQGGTNPTAAALVALSCLGSVSDEVRDGAADFLSQVWLSEGGFRANRRIPVVDLLSTFTALTACWELGLRQLVDGQRVRRFVQSQLELPGGGFRAGLWDEQADVEYTFYGLGCLALAAQFEPGSELSGE